MSRIHLRVLRNKRKKRVYNSADLEAAFTDIPGGIAKQSGSEKK
jgi:hypothetical protein